MLCLSAVACGADREELSWPVDQLGKHRIAYRQYHADYTPPGATAERSLRLAIWYPTSATEGTPAKYMDSFERPGVFSGGPAIDTEKLPVAIFSHGNLSFAEQSWFLGEYFASHGFLVLAPDHTGNTLVNAGDERGRDVFSLRPRDLSAVLDTRNALPGLSERAGEEVIVLGHSFGGYTTLAISGADPAPGTGLDATLADERIDAAVAMAAGNHAEFAGGGAAKIEVPVMLMTGAMDRAVPNATEGELYWAELDGESDRRVDLPRGGHHTFDIACEIFPLLGEEDGCGEAFVASVEAQGLISTDALAFARRHLFGDESVDAILDGTTPLSGEAVLSRK
jgi:predicted dienelactone hydrolase